MTDPGGGIPLAWAVSDMEARYMRVAHVGWAGLDPAERSRWYAWWLHDPQRRRHPSEAD